MEGGPLIMQPVVVVVVATCLLGNLSTPRLSSNKAVTSGSCKYDKNITDLKLTDIEQDETFSSTERLCHILEIRHF